MEKYEPGKSYPVAYRYGELLALLEAIQKMAVGGKASLTDRFYGSASSAPASVFWNLMRGNRAHMSKLRKNKPGMFQVFEKDLESVIHEIPRFKKVLSLEEQGLFSLGYYHRKASMRSRAIKAKLERENKLNKNNQGE